MYAPPGSLEMFMQVYFWAPEWAGQKKKNLEGKSQGRPNKQVINYNVHGY